MAANSQGLFWSELLGSIYIASVELAQAHPETTHTAITMQPAKFIADALGNKLSSNSYHGILPSIQW